METPTKSFSEKLILHQPKVISVHSYFSPCCYSHYEQVGSARLRSLFGDASAGLSFAYAQAYHMPPIRHQ